MVICGGAPSRCSNGQPMLRRSMFDKSQLGESVGNRTVSRTHLQRSPTRCPSLLNKYENASSRLSKGSRAQGCACPWLFGVHCRSSGSPGYGGLKNIIARPYDRTEPRNPNCFIADRSLESEDAGRIEEGLGGAHLARFRLTPLCPHQIASDVGAARLFSQKGSAPS